MTTKSHKFRIDEDLWNNFKTVCTENGTDCSTQIREMISQYCSVKPEQSSKQLYTLIDSVYKRTGRVTWDMIQTNTNGNIEFQEAKNYCIQKHIPIIYIGMEETKLYKGEL